MFFVLYDVLQWIQMTCEKIFNCVNTSGFFLLRVLNGNSFAILYPIQILFFYSYIRIVQWFSSFFRLLHKKEVWGLGTTKTWIFLQITIKTPVLFLITLLWKPTNRCYEFLCYTHRCLLGPCETGKFSLRPYWNDYGN